MRTVAVCTETIEFFPVPFSGPFPVNAGLPVPKDCSVALSAEKIKLFEIDQFSIDQVEFITVLCTVTVEAPHARGMPQLDVLVRFVQRSPLGIDLQVLMAV